MINTASEFFFIGLCSSDDNLPPPGICEGIEPFVRGRGYSEGEQVTFRGYLFTRLTIGWRREGKCD